jgi:chromosome segregation ATPase
MKLRLMLCSLMLTLASIAWANELTDAISQAKGELDANAAALQQASSNGKEAEAQYSQLADSVAPLKAKTEQYKRQREEQDQKDQAIHADYQALGQRMAAHNGNRCYAPADNLGACAAYDAEAADLNTQKDTLASRRDTARAQDAELEKQRADLSTQWDNLKQDTMKQWGAMKAARSQYNDLLQARARIVERLTALQNQSADCKKQLRARGQGSKDYLKNQCGNVQFDGSSANLPPPPPDPPQ